MKKKDLPKLHSAIIEEFVDIKAAHNNLGILIQDARGQIDVIFEGMGMRPSNKIFDYIGFKTTLLKGESMHQTNLKNKVVYIAGRMRGMPNLNWHEFDMAEKMLESKGAIPINPANHDREAGYTPESLGKLTKEEFDKFLRQCFAKDLDAICNKCHAMYMLRGWEEGKGSVAEHKLAEAIEMPIFYE